jgi:hypothetical protein
VRRPAQGVWVWMGGWVTGLVGGVKVVEHTRWRFSRGRAGFEAVCGESNVSLVFVQAPASC